MRKYLGAILALFLVSNSLSAQQWQIDKGHSNLGFSITYLGIVDIVGIFQDADVHVTSAKKDFSDAVVELSANVSHISTGETQRDAYLKSSDFFDVAKYGTLIFKSTAIRKTADGLCHLTGDLTMHGITKKAEFTFRYNGTTNNPYTNHTVAGFRVTGSVSRTDFQLGADFPAPGLSDTARLEANIILNAIK